MLVRSLLTMLGFDVDTRGMQRYDKGLKNVMKTTIRFAAITGTAIAALGTAFFKGAGDIEQIEVAFETMLGSVEKAKSLLIDITQLAEKTPFQLMEIVKGSKQLLAFGIAGEDIIDTMTNLGNISAGIGRDKLGTLVRAFGKIRTKGRASMEELNMMLEAGVPILDEIAKKMNMKVGPALFNLVEKGLVSFSIVNESIKDLSNGTGRFADLMIKQSKTLLGMISNIKDVFTNLVNAIGKDLLPDGKRLARLFLEWITLNKEMIRVNVVKFYEKLLKAIQKVVKFFEKFKIIGNIGDFLRALLATIRIFGNVINKVFTKDGEGVINFLARWVNENKKLIATKMVNFVKKAAIAFEKFLEVVKEAWPFIVALVGALLGLKAFAAIGALIAALSNPLVLIIAAITILGGLLILLVKNWDSVWGSMQLFGHDVVTLFKDIGKGIEEFLYQVANEFRSIRDEILIFFGRIGLKIKSIFEKAIENIKNLFKALLLVLKTLFDKVFGEGAFAKTLTTIQDLITATSELLEKFNLLGKAKELDVKIKRKIPTPVSALPPGSVKIPGSGNGSKNTLTVNAVVNVPPGTAAEQVRVVEEAANVIFTDVAATNRGLAALAAFEEIQ